jgi:tetratricopeptide (TPR) repeat protein
MTRSNAMRAAPALALLALILIVTLSSPISEKTRFTPLPDAAQDRLTANLQAARVMQALYQIEAQAAQSGWTRELQLMAGDLWRDIGDLTRAVAYWEAAASTDSDNPELARQLAQAFLTLQRWTEAAAALDHLLTLVPDDSWAHYQLGLIRAPFDPQAAITHLQAVTGDAAYGESARAILPALLNNPADPLISMRVGVALADQNLWPYAELAFQHAAVVGQPFPEALAYAGLSRDQQGKDGSVWIEQALALEPQNPQVLYLHGLHLRVLGEYAQSLDTLIQAATLDPQNPAFLAELGAAYRLVNDMPSAEYWLKTAAALSLGDPGFQELLARFYAEEGYNLTAGGLETLEQTVALLPDDPDVRASYGWALYILGDAEAALSQLDTALAIAPAHPQALYYKAQIWLETGNPGAAEPLFEQVAAADSEFAEEAQRILQTLRE